MKYVWKDVDDFAHVKSPYAMYLIYNPNLDDEEYPGHPVFVSNPDYITSGNAKRDGFTKYMALLKP